MLPIELPLLYGMAASDSVRFPGRFRRATRSRAVFMMNAHTRQITIVRDYGALTETQKTQVKRVIMESCGENPPARLQTTQTAYRPSSAF